MSDKGKKSTNKKSPNKFLKRLKQLFSKNETGAFTITDSVKLYAIKDEVYEKYEV